MPSRTPQQKRAMQAAARGQSKLGIPKAVGQEFVRADKASDRGMKENSPADRKSDKKPAGKPFGGKKATPFTKGKGKR